MNDRAERLRAEAWRWMSMAREDLVGAERSAADSQLAPRLACYWAMQSAELALKAVLVAEDVDPPKTHDLLDLANRCADPGVRALDIGSLAFLSQFAAAARYPADAPDITDDTPDALIAIAMTALAAASGALQSTVGPEIPPAAT